MHFLLAYIGMHRPIDTLIHLSNCDDDDDEHGDVHYCYPYLNDVFFDYAMHV